jgi:hypothetical protein
MKLEAGISGLPSSRYSSSNRVGCSHQFTLIYPEAKLQTYKTGEPANARRRCSLGMLQTV